MLKQIALIMLALSVLLLAGCGEEKVYDWQRPHQTYQVGAFSQGQAATDLKTKLQRGGYESRIETGIKNGEYQYNVLVDIYDMQPDTLSRLEQITGVRPFVRNNNASKPQQNAIPSGDI